MISDGQNLPPRKSHHPFSHPAHYGHPKSYSTQYYYSSGKTSSSVYREMTDTSSRGIETAASVKNDKENNGN